jgi:hypothetical protein
MPAVRSVSKWQQDYQVWPGKADGNINQTNRRPAYLAECNND